MNYVDRPTFMEGQLLSAAELELTVTYAREALEDHERYAHTNGIVDGMALQTIPAGASPGTPVAIVVTPGFAVDEQGRQIEIVTQMGLPADNIRSLPTNPYPAFVWLTESSLMPVGASDPCQTVIERVRETVHVGVFPDAATAQGQAPGAIPLGDVAWDAAQQSFVPNTDTDAAHDTRRRAGVRASEVVAPEHRVVVHAEDKAPADFQVEGTIEVTAAQDGTTPAIDIADGGALEFSPAGAPAGAAPVAIGCILTGTTGNELVVDLGNTDPQSEFVIQKHGAGGLGTGTPVATIDATGTLGVSTVNSTTVNAASNVTVGSGNTTLSMQSVAPSGDVGLSAPGSLPIAFGAGLNDAAVFVAGANPVAAIDAHTITTKEKSVAIGTIDTSAGTAGVATTAGDPLVLGTASTASNDVVIAPGMAQFLRFTSAGELINMLAGAIDITPSWEQSGTASLVRLGPIAIAYGTTTLTQHPISAAAAAISFPKPFANPPAFFVSAFKNGTNTVTAVPTSVDVNGANYRILLFTAGSMSAGSNPQWSDAQVHVNVSWIAFGTM
ncbi:MAG: hypothetical protein JO165_06625 [Candidatus Eremiobacteraeota bacterium]|nr:hypothetical protein [Candidatus Eremiobacteraeota bacterium]